MVKYFYCPSCHHINRVELDYNIKCNDNNLNSALMCTYDCECGGEAVDIDENMVHIIRELNIMGLKTQYCCEGHIKNKFLLIPYISFDHTITITTFNFIKFAFGIPDGWIVDESVNDVGAPIISLYMKNYNNYDLDSQESIDKFNEDRLKAIKNLYDWILLIKKVADKNE